MTGKAAPSKVAATEIAHQHLLRSMDALMDHRAGGDDCVAALLRPLIDEQLAYWEGLTVFLEHLWLDLDNNAAERALRAAVVGRKNFYG